MGAAQEHRWTGAAQSEGSTEQEHRWTGAVQCGASAGRGQNRVEAVQVGDNAGQPPVWTEPEEGRAELV